MTGDGDQPYVDPQTLGDRDMQVYETVATLEFLGRVPTRSQIGAAAGVEDGELDEMLRSLTERHLLVRSQADGEPAFQPARRDWSAVPEDPAGPQRLP
ncbi:MAG TPA: hypothetical protein VGM79_05565 [Streptosporangiaceae bacterium]|jgi:hypothetical protein